MGGSNIDGFGGFLSWFFGWGFGLFLLLFLSRLRLLGSIFLLFTLVLVSLLVLSGAVFFFLISMLVLVLLTIVTLSVVVLAWRLLILALVLVLSLHSHLLWVVNWLNLHLWLGDHHWSRLSVETHTVNLRLHGNWSWAQILVWIESSKGGHLSEAGDLDQGWWLVVQWVEVEWRN